MTYVAIVGHSFVKRLDRALEGSLSNLGFDNNPKDIDVQCIGKSGGKRTISYQLRLIRPDLVLLQIGGQFGSPTISVGIFITYLIPTLISILDSIADYYACAKVVNAPPPPFHAITRGLATEGFFSFLAGSFGVGHATTTYGGNIGIIGVTKVGSLRVFQMFGVQLVVVAMIAKLSACFVAIPYPVIGGTTFIMTGSFFGIIFSNLSFVNLNSTRNLVVIGMSLLCGLMIPLWSKQNMDKLETGIQQLTYLVKILMTNASFMGGLAACLLDNTLPGTREDRGILAWKNDLNDEETDTPDYQENTDTTETLQNCDGRITQLITEKYPDQRLLNMDVDMNPFQLRHLECPNRSGESNANLTEK
ncbi:solute carrier family 23 member 2-like [Ylistrum balloti]|uniref:solute carrier family 23 member 2-like n=1 Tax=Ylistrum balloti TaxID=509963 RepID=UPI00290593CE|nr:solute carrier family 23 member 2-like [Ylistrum balloti]